MSYCIRFVHILAISWPALSFGKHLCTICWEQNCGTHGPWPAQQFQGSINRLGCGHWTLDNGTVVVVDLESDRHGSITAGSVIEIHAYARWAVRRTTAKRWALDGWQRAGRLGLPTMRSTEQCLRGNWAWEYRVHYGTDSVPKIFVLGGPLAFMVPPSSLNISSSSTLQTHFFCSSGNEPF